MKSKLLSLLILLLLSVSTFGANYYVDPTINTDTGDGLTPATAWGAASGSKIQRALNLITKGANGDQINVKSTGTDSLTAALDFTTYGDPTVSQPLTIRGYTAVANDGGKGSILGAGGATSLVPNTKSHLHFVDLQLNGNGTTGVWVDLFDFCSVTRCEVHNVANTVMFLRAKTTAVECDVYDGSGEGIRLNGAMAKAIGNFVHNAGTRDFTTAIYANDFFCGVQNNIIYVDGTTDGIRMFVALDVIGNSILSLGGTGTGILSITSNNLFDVFNNLVEGFSGAGGFGFEDPGGTSDVVRYANNTFFNNATNQSARHTSIIDSGNNVVTATLFEKTGSATFANRMNYFAPRNIGGIIGGALESNADRGAVQRKTVQRPIIHKR